MKRRTFLAASLLAAPALAQNIKRIRMATSWTKNLPGPGESAARIAEQLNKFTSLNFEVQVFGAGEIVPPFSVFDAVSSGAVEMGHTASFFNAGKDPAFNFFTTVPNGLTPLKHTQWLEESGQALWDEFYAAYNVKPFQGGNVGASYGGWFKKPIESFKGIKIRSVGLGGEVLQRLGATALAIPPSDIYSALERGVIDAVEFTAPASDERLGLYKIAPYYYRQTFTKPNGSSEFIVNLPFFKSLSTRQQDIVARICGGELVDSLINSYKQNDEALVRLKDKGTILSDFPSELIEKAKVEAVNLRIELLTRSPAAKKIGEDYDAFQKKLTW